MYLDQLLTDLATAYEEANSLKGLLSGFFAWIKVAAGLSEITQLQDVVSIEHLELSPEELLYISKRSPSGEDLSRYSQTLKQYQQTKERISEIEEMIRICSVDTNPEVVISSYSTFQTQSTQESIDNIDSALQGAHIEYQALSEYLAPVQLWLQTSASLPELVSFLRTWGDNANCLFEVSTESALQSQTRSHSNFDISPFLEQLRHLKSIKKEIALLEKLSDKIVRDHKNRPEKLFISRIKIIKESAIRPAWIN